MTIYFISRPNDPSIIKIGKARDMRRRLVELHRFADSSAWADEADFAANGAAGLVLTASCDGYSECERALHRMLAAYRSWGEWFRLEGPVSDVLAFVKAGGPECLTQLCPEAFAFDKQAELVYVPQRSEPGTPPVAFLAKAIDTTESSCDHGAMRALHPQGKCVLCEPNTRPADPVKPITPLIAPSAEHIFAALGVQLEPEERTETYEEIRAELLDTERKLSAELARRSFKEFVRQAVDAGAVLGVSRLEWTDHLDGQCHTIQSMFEGWFAATGNLPTDCDGNLTEHGAEMLARVDAQWQAHGIERVPGECLVQNIVGNLPPGTLKSTLLMVLAPAWVWLIHPAFKFGALSAIESNVSRDAKAHRDVVTSKWYRDTFEIRWTIRGDSDAIQEWGTTAGGVRMSRTMQQGLTGTHVHAIAVDDPNDADKVYQEPSRRGTQDRWTRAIENRVIDERTCLRFVYQQRVHVDDQSAYLLSLARWSPDDENTRKGWAWFCVPMTMGRAPKDAPKTTPFGWTDAREEGETLQPERFTPAVLADKRAKMANSRLFDAQYEQNPIPLEGGMFKERYLRFFRISDSVVGPTRRPLGCTEEPAYTLRRLRNGALDLEHLCLTVDATFGSLKETASAVSILVIGVKEQRRFVLDNVTRPMDFPTTKAEIRKLITKWGPDRALIERKANGESVLVDLRTELAEGIYEESEGRIKRVPILGPDGKPALVALESIETGGDGKEARANGMIGTWEAGLIYVLDGAVWIPQFVGEVCLFPNARRDDQVDALGQAVTWYRDGAGACARAAMLNSY